MNPQRRRWLQTVMAAGATGAAGAAGAADGDAVRRGRPLVFPRDHGAHLQARTEWWYATGWLADAAAPDSPAAPTHGFQVTFFRSRTGFAQALPGRFAPRQLLFAHAAVTDLGGARHLHDQRIARWSEAPDASTGRAALADADLQLAGWTLRRDASGPAAVWRTALSGRDFALTLDLARTQPPLLQGEAGFSRKGPDERQASHYYSEPQLAATGQLTLQGRPLRMAGRAWLDHEWSDEILHPDAVGWDWIGMNLLDGGALTAFRLRRRDGSTLWAGGSLRAAGQATGSAAPRVFEPNEVQWQPGRPWRSPASGAVYPLEWALRTPAGAFSVRALLDGQELDSRASTGSIYWEGLSELLDAAGRRVGLGYLELTGYAAPLRMG